MIEIDGSQGEGGGQMLRTSLSLSCITGKGFRIRNIRKAREKPGLMHQHLMAVHSAARISSAEVVGDQLGSKELAFVPRRVIAGDYHFDIGTAGSTILVLQTLIPPLLTAGRPSRVTVIGGTHLPFSPSWQYLTEVFAPAVARLGVRLHLEADSCGFYPKGGGRVHCRIEPVSHLSPMRAEQRGRLLRITGCSAVGNLPLSIAERQMHSAIGHLRSSLSHDLPIEVSLREVKVFGQGTFIFLKAEYEECVAGFTALGARGKPAERVGEEAADELLAHHQSGLPIDPHLADQLVLYLAQADGPSVYATSRITKHLETNLMVASKFVDIATKLHGELDGPGTVMINPASTSDFGQ
jgi:RNA 3'-terminal phosphate cyclase (ATP)